MKYIFHFLYDLGLVLFRLLWLVWVAAFVCSCAVLTAVWHLNVRWNVIKAVRQAAFIGKDEPFLRWLFGDWSITGELFDVFIHRVFNTERP
jgi:hypothetical protein